MKRAKFEIEIEYTNEDAGLHERDIKVINYDVEGDYKGLVLAMVTGLAFARKKDASNFEVFKDKLKVLRATASSLVSALGTITRMKALPELDDGNELILGEAVKRLTDYVSLGLAKMLGLSEDEVLEANEDYKNINKANNESNDSEEEGTSGTERTDFDDYL